MAGWLVSMDSRFRGNDEALLFPASFPFSVIPGKPPTSVIPGESPIPGIPGKFFLLRHSGRVSHPRYSG